MRATAICKGFPTLPHKGGLAEWQRVRRHCLLPGTTRAPLAVPLSVKQYNATTPALPPTPTLLTQLPTTHTLDTGSGDMFFFFGECGLLVNG